LRSTAATSASGRVTDQSPVLLSGVVVAVTMRLTCEIDGRRTVIEETGDVGQPTNRVHDGERIKDAKSIAIKRCAARIGVALNLYAGGDYFLDAWLTKRGGIAAVVQMASDGAR